MSRNAFLLLRNGLAGLCLITLVSAASAQGIDLGGHDGNKPISVSAKSFRGSLKTKDLTYSGDVVVSQGNFKLHSDQVRITDNKGKIDRMIASGKVLFVAPSGTASGSKAVYDTQARVITLSGNVILTKGKNVMRGTELTMDLASGKAKLTARGTPGGRVQGLFTPPPRHKASKDNGEN